MYSETNISSIVHGGRPSYSTRRAWNAPALPWDCLSFSVSSSRLRFRVVKRQSWIILLDSFRVDHCEGKCHSTTWPIEYLEEREESEWTVKLNTQKGSSLPTWDRFKMEVNGLLQHWTDLKYKSLPCFQHWQLLLSRQIHSIMYQRQERRRDLAWHWTASIAIAKPSSLGPVTSFTIWHSLRILEAGTSLIPSSFARGCQQCFT